MGIFDELKNLVGEAEDMAKQHPDQVKAALAKAEVVIDEKTGHKYTSQLQEGVAKASEFVEAKPTTPPTAPPAKP
jgi:hypothetical protein